MAMLNVQTVAGCIRVGRIRGGRIVVDKIMQLYQDLIDAKKYDMAKLLLQFIDNKYLILPLTGEAGEMVWMLEQEGCVTYYHFTDDKATVYLIERSESTHG